jgi:predicted metal-dependent TIM-barrel fold hydrolase
MNTYTWQINQLDCYPTEESQTNVIFAVHWRINATDETHNVTSYGVQSLTYMVGNPFTPFEQLTEETIIDWVKTAIGAEQVTSIQANLNTQIANLVNPPVISPRLPWLPVSN